MVETGSTNADLVLGAGIVPDGSVLVTDHQTAGRGRLDRRWDAPPGANLLFSVLLRPTWDSDRHPLVTAALAVATVEALGTHGVQAAVKWPNDVLLVGGTAPGKVAGILAELVGGGPAGGPVAIVVGMGVNVGWPAVSDAAPPGATSLAAAGHTIDRADLLQSILTRL